MEGRQYLRYPHTQPFVEFLRECIGKFNKSEDGRMPLVILCNREDFLTNVSKEEIKEFETFQFTDEEITGSNKYEEFRIKKPKKFVKIELTTYPTLGESKQDIAPGHVWLLKD